MKNGFILVVGRNLYFLESERQRKCKSVIDAFITALCNIRGYDDEFRKKCLEHEPTRQDIDFRISKATYEIRGKDNWKYHCFIESNGQMNFPLNDCEEVHFIQ